jgi:hypothetical protein
MSLGLNGTDQNRVDAAFRSLKVIWLAILVSVITLFVVTRIVQPGTSNIQILFWILLALGLMTFGASFVMKQNLLKQGMGKNNFGMVQTAYIMAFALCEATAIFGMVAFFVTGAQYYYFFFVLSGFGIILHKPQRDDLLAASGENKVWK